MTAPVDRAMKASLEPFERGASGENPYKVQHDLQDTMQALVGIVRTENEMQEAISKIAGFRERASRVGVDGHREFNSGWHTCIDLRNLLDVVRGDRAIGDRAQGEPRRPLPRRLPGQEG